MIRVEVSGIDRQQTTVWLTPTNAYGGVGVRWAASTVVGAMSGITTLIMWPGGGLAAIIAIAQAVVLALMMRHSWRGTERYEKVMIDDDHVVVRAFPNGPNVSFQLHWVRAIAEPGNGRLIMTSHGRRLEIGSFLDEDERRRALATIIALLNAQRSSTSSLSPTAGRAQQTSASCSPIW